ncbi:MAG: type VI secretion lipoprotein TssJ [Methylococcales bacterium]|nr:type VI secretion lipoprotein TssJ [Methylococcales bacterium]
MANALLLALVLMITACVQKVEPPQSVKLVIVEPWHWDDQQQHWVDKGTVFDAEAKNLAQMSWEHQKKAILLEIDSATLLNNFDKKPNALLMKVFQFSDSRAFLIATKSTSGLKRLLTAEQIDPACIETEHFIVLPGRKQTLILDRAEGARYLGVVFGYSNFKQSKISRLIPIVTLKKNKKIDRSPSSISQLDTLKITDDINNRPALLTLKLFLGTNGINNLDINIK